MPEKDYKYTCVGSVRGCCGKVHASLDEAYLHIHTDQKGCEKQGGYSDRRPVSGKDKGYSYTYSDYCLMNSETAERIGIE